MRTLVIDSATEACSVALFEQDTLLSFRHELLGRGHAERLVPMIAELPDKGRAQRILVARGPGSFTGVRIGIAAARALALAWQSKIFGYPTLALIAAQAQHMMPAAVTVCMHGGHGEWFVQNFSPQLAAEDAVRSLPPQQAAEVCRHTLIAGNRAAQMADLFPASAGKQSLDLLPDARSAILLAADSLSNDTSPLYGRAPDAKPSRQAQ